MKSWFAAKAKARLDGRYALRADIRRLQSEIKSLERQVAKLQKPSELPAGTHGNRGDQFVGKEDPTELRKRLFDAHRLAREGAMAIETILAEEIELWQTIDALAIDPLPEDSPIVECHDSLDPPSS